MSKDNPLILVTGGCRSGKSEFARQLAEQIPGPRLFIATSPCSDSEMAERIQLHKEARLQAGWQTIEEQLHPAMVINKAESGATIIVDCLTLWINNLLFDAENQGLQLTEQDIVSRVRILAEASAHHSGSVFMVSGEVGQGIVPEHELARRYRDLVGRCNQCMAAAADQVFLVSCGIGLQLK